MSLLSHLAREEGGHVVLTNDELAGALKNEVRTLLHLISKVETPMLDFRPTAKQRSLLELLQYLTIMGPIHLRAVMADTFDMDAWRQAWTAGKANAKSLNLEEMTAALGAQSGLFAELVRPASDADLRAEIEMFGHKASRGSMLVSLVLNHYVGYCMQVFLYLKMCGLEELSTINLWAGMDTPRR